MKRSDLNGLGLMLLVLVSGAGIAIAQQTEVSWINPGGGSWSTAADWSDGVVPNNGSGQTYGVTLPTLGSYYGVSLDMSPTVDSLTLQSNTELVGYGSETFSTGSLINGGLIYFSNSTLNVNGPVTNSGSLYDAVMNVTGTFSNAGGFAEIYGPFTAAHYVQTGNGSYTEIQGTMNVQDAVVDAGPFDLDHGSTLNGNLDMNGGAFGMNCEHFPSCPPTVLNGNFTSTASSLYSEGIDIIPGVVDQLVVSGDATLGGTLDLSFGGRVSGGESFDIMTYLSETGQFSTVDVSGLGFYQIATLDYGPTALDVVVVDLPTPEPGSMILMGTTMIALAYGCRRKLAQN